MTVRFNSDFSAWQENGLQPVNHVDLRNHWVAFEQGRWNSDQLYRTRLSQLHTSVYDPHQPTPTWDEGTPTVASLDRLDANGTLLVDPDAGHRVGEHEDERRHLVITRTDQTGDIPHVAAALVHDPMLDVLVIHPATRPDAARDAVATYRGAVRHSSGYEDASRKTYQGLMAPGDRVRTLSQDNGPGWYAALLPSREEEHVPVGGVSFQGFSAHQRRAFSYQRLDGAWVEYATMTVGGTTTLVAEAYRREGTARFFTANIDGLACPASEISDGAIEAFMRDAYGLDLRPQTGRDPASYVLLWSRYSGQRPGGYNPAGDSSTAGNAQLIQFIKQHLRLPVITIGHDPAHGVQTPHGDIHLGEFWTNTAHNNPFLDRGRPGQTRLYTLLNRRRNIVQLGQKTGGMDNAALIGMRTVYIEDVHSPQRDRMAKWSSSMAHYRMAAVSAPPSPLGRAIRAHDGDEAAARRALAGDTGSQRTYLDGYDREDRELIADLVQGLLTAQHTTS